MNKIVMQTDFGCMPSAMVGVCKIVDPALKVYPVAFDVPTFNIEKAGNNLVEVLPYWPAGTVFVSVVDPGVGTTRRSCVAKLDNGSYVVTPDNGTLTYLYDHVVAVREIDETVNRLPGSGNHHTFHGRDVYAYTAARLASGIIDYAGVGPEYPVTDIIRFSTPTAEIVDGCACGEITSASDHFGNVGISVPNEMIHAIGINLGDMARLEIIKDGNVIYDKEMMFHRSFGWVKVGELIMNECSNDYVEISVNQGSFVAQELPEVEGVFDLSAYKVRISKAGK